MRAALALLDDHITRAASRRAVPRDDLRLVCTDAADHADPIEPSVAGGAEIARAVAALVAAGGDVPRSHVVA